MKSFEEDYDFPAVPVLFTSNGKDVHMARKNIKRAVARNGDELAMPVLKEVTGGPRTLDARPDTPDFRDKLYDATLVEVPPMIPLEDYQQRGVPILDQGQEGACTGFG